MEGWSTDTTRVSKNSMVLRENYYHQENNNNKTKIKQTKIPGEDGGEKKSYIFLSGI
jgi:hypothetical protein